MASANIQANLTSKINENERSSLGNYFSDVAPTTLLQEGSKSKISDFSFLKNPKLSLDVSLNHLVFPP